MSSRSRATSGPPVMTSPTVPWLQVLGGFGWVRIRRREVGEGARGRSGRVVDTVTDYRPVSGVDQLGEDRVHHIVVERPPAAGFMRLTAAPGKLDLQEAVLGVRLGEVDDQEVGEHEARQGVVPVSVRVP